MMPALTEAVFVGGGQPVHLATTILVIFGSAKLLAELFERLGQPGIVGEIAAGVLIGPTALGWVSPNEFTATMAEFGVLFLLFEVGLEVDSAELIKLGKTGFTVGLLGIIVPFAAGWAVCALLGKPGIESVFVGTALTATSVGITAKALAARNLLHRTASRIILAAAVVDDILALLLLGVVTSVANGHVNLLELGLTSALAIVFVGLVARWGSRAMSPVIAFLQGRLRVGEGEFALAIILMFGLAVLSAKIGVASIIGAFLAGMALAGSAPTRVHDLSRGVAELFVPFFLAEIGLHLDLRVFKSMDAILLAVLLVPVAILSKVVGCGLGARSFGREIAIRVGVGMVPRGEFCMVVAQVGLGMAAISNEAYAAIVAMAVCAAMLAPPLLKWSFRAVLAPEVASSEITGK